MPTLFTVGHSTLPLDAFIEMLQSHGVAHIVDVRRYPGSRRHPHFSKEQLPGALAEAGIGYTHEVDLGGRRAPAPDSPNTGWRSASFRAYADHLASPQFQQALDRTIVTAQQVPTAVMCAEAVPWRCHRQLIADVMVARGWDVLNITARDRAEPHRLNPMAHRAPDGTLTYPAPADEQPGLF